MTVHWPASSSGTHFLQTASSQSGRGAQAGASAVLHADCLLEVSATLPSLLPASLYQSSIITSKQSAAVSWLWPLLLAELPPGCLHLLTHSSQQCFAVGGQETSHTRTKRRGAGEVAKPWRETRAVGGDRGGGEESDSVIGWKGSISTLSAQQFSLPVSGYRGSRCNICSEKSTCWSVAR